MAQKRRTAGIVLVCLLLPLLLVGGPLKAGHYTLVTWRVWPWYRPWHSGTTLWVDNRSVSGYGFTAFKYGIGAYRPQDMPPPLHNYIISAQVVDRQGRGVSDAMLEVRDLSGVLAETETGNVYASGSNGNVPYAVASKGIYNVTVDRHGYLPIKKRVKVGPNGAFVKFVLPRAGRGGAPVRRLPANARW